MAKKLPAMWWYTGDWKKDPAVTCCRPATRGIWFDLLNAMHDAGRSGKLSGTAEQLAPLGRCSTAELMDALTDLQMTGAAEVQQRNGLVTIINRRMSREARRRQLDSARQVKARGRRKSRRGHDDVTRHTSSSISTSTSSPPAPDCDAATEERKKQVVMVMKQVSSRGVVNARGCCQKAIDNGASLDEILAIVNHYDRGQGCKPEALHERIAEHVPGQSPEVGWLPGWRKVPPQKAEAIRKEASETKAFLIVRDGRRAKKPDDVIAKELAAVGLEWPK